MQSNAIRRWFPVGTHNVLGYYESTMNSDNDRNVSGASVRVFSHKHARNCASVHCVKRLCQTAQWTYLWIDWKHSKVSEIVDINETNINFVLSLLWPVCEIVCISLQELRSLKKYLGPKQSPPISHNGLEQDPARCHSLIREKRYFSPLSMFVLWYNTGVVILTKDF